MFYNPFAPIFRTTPLFQSKDIDELRDALVSDRPARPPEFAGNQKPIDDVRDPDYIKELTDEGWDNCIVSDRAFRFNF